MDISSVYAPPHRMKSPSYFTCVYRFLMLRFNLVTCRSGTQDTPPRWKSIPTRCKYVRKLVCSFRFPCLWPFEKLKVPPLFLQPHRVLFYTKGSRYGFLFLINCSTSFYNEPFVYFDQLYLNGFHCLCI